MPLEVEAQVQQRLREHLLRAEQHVIKSRPTRPLPSRNGWIVSTWT